MKDKRNIKVYLDDILESIEKIENYTDNISEEEFYDKEQIQDSVLRRIEIMGEAVSNIPEKFKNERSEIPWREISGMRNVLIHKYFGVNMKRVWKVIKEDVPTLKKKISKIRKNIT